MKWLILSAVLAAPFAAEAATPEELGALASPQAFAEACAEVRDNADKIQAEAAKEKDGDIAVGTIALMSQYCVDMVRAVAATAVNYGDAKPVGMQSGICLKDATITDAEVLNQVIYWESEHRDKIKNLGVNTPDMILSVLSQMAKCP